MTVENEWESLAQQVGRQVRELRKLRGWTQADLAERMGRRGHEMHQTTVAKLESASRPTTLDEIAALAAVLDVDLSVLIEPWSTRQRSDDARLREALADVARARDEVERKAAQLAHLKEAHRAAFMEQEEALMQLTIYEDRLRAVRAQVEQTRAEAVEAMGGENVYVQEEKGKNNGER